MMPGHCSICCASVLSQYIYIIFVCVSKRLRHIYAYIYLHIFLHIYIYIHLFIYVYELYMYMSYICIVMVKNPHTYTHIATKHASLGHQKKQVFAPKLSPNIDLISTNRTHRTTVHRNLFHKSLVIVSRIKSGIWG